MAKTGKILTGSERLFRENLEHFALCVEEFCPSVLYSFPSSVSWTLACPFNLRTQFLQERPGLEVLSCDGIPLSLLALLGPNHVYSVTYYRMKNTVAKSAF